MSGMPSISVVVSTFGEARWKHLAQKAADSARHQTLPCEVILHHDEDLHLARNNGAAKASGEYLIFLDADDTLNSTYVESMAAAAAEFGPRNLYQPRTSYRHPHGSVVQPYFLPAAPNLLHGNHLVIGTMVSKEVFDEVGGFRDLPILEDWDLWTRCWIYAGVGFQKVEGAVYQVVLNYSGRNTGSESSSVYTRVRRELYPEALGRGLVG